jgi:hypothetical protein
MKDFDDIKMHGTMIKKSFILTFFSKYLPNVLICSMLVHINIFLYAISLFIFNHLSFANIILQFLVPKHCSNMCWTSSSPPHKGPHPLHVLRLIRISYHTAASNHVIPLDSLDHFSVHDLLPQEEFIYQ